MATTIEDMPPAETAAEPPVGASRSRSGEQGHDVPATQPGSTLRQRSVSFNVILSGAFVLLAAVVTVFGSLLVAQLMALDSSIDRIDAKIDDVETGLRAEIDDVESSLRSEMQAGFAQINATLLDHTDRLARLEAHAGLASVTPDS